MSTELPAIKVTDIAEYIRFHSCDRRFKLKYDNYKQVHTDIPQFANLIFNTSLDK